MNISNFVSFIYCKIASFHSKIERGLLHTTPYVTKQKMFHFAYWVDTKGQILQETSDMGVAGPETLEKGLE